MLTISARKKFIKWKVFVSGLESGRTAYSCADDRGGGLSDLECWYFFIEGEEWTNDSSIAEEVQRITNILEAFEKEAEKGRFGVVYPPEC